MKIKSILLVIASLFILNILFTYRYSPEEFYKQDRLWQKGEFNKNPLDCLKLYFSRPVDEGYYYEWSTLVLGKTFEENYPLEERRAWSSVEKHFSESPHRRMPYRDVRFEYPPLLAVPILAVRSLSENFTEFTKIFAFFLSLAYLAILWTAHKIWLKIPENKKLSWPTILLLSTFSLLLLGQIYVTRLDLIPNLLYLLALHALLDQKYYQSTLWIVLGSLTKAYPLLLAPILLLILLREKKYKEMILNSLLGLGLILGINLFIGWMTEGHYWESYSFHRERGIQIESVYALIPYLGKLFFHIPIQIYERHTSINIEMPHFAWAKQLSGYLVFILPSILYFFFWKNMKKNSSNPLFLIQAATLTLFSFILAFKVLSPQFLIWLIPLLFLNNPNHRKIFFGLFLTGLLLTQLIWPNFYSLLEKGDSRGIILLLFRNGILLILFGWLTRDFLLSSTIRQSLDNAEKPTRKTR